MAEPFIAEIRMFSFHFPPRGWAQCDGQIIGIAQNQALFSLLGTTFGGNGSTTFGLPDLRGRVPVHAGGPGAKVGLGEAGGEAAHTLTIAEMPAHFHQAMGDANPATEDDPTGRNWGATSGDESVNKPYSTSAPDALMAQQALAPAGSNKAHENMQPYLAVNFCIALRGIFPTRN